MPRGSTTDRKLEREQQMRQALAEEIKRRGLAKRLEALDSGPSEDERYWREENERCRQDPVYFVDTHCKVTSDRGKGVIPFRLWDYQKEILKSFHTNREVIVLKGRQLGVSEIVAAYTLWFITYNPSVTAIVLSKSDREAQELLNKSWLCFRHLPDQLRVPLRDTTRTSTIELSNGSRILPMPTTRGAGRSYNAQLLVFDEWAFQMFQEEIFAAAAPTARSAGNKIIGISTANGLGNFYATQWQEAQEGRGAVPIFLPWNVRPGRDEKWYVDATRGMPEWQKAQEYPSTADEAFIMTGRPRFSIDALDVLLETSAAEPVREDLGGDLRIWEEPVPGKRYVCGADPSEGLLKGDYSAAVVLDTETGLDVACLHGHFSPDAFARYLAELCRFYQNAYLGIERNNHGHACLLAIVQLYGYENLHFHHEYDGQPTKMPGWLTSLRSKPILVEGLSRAIGEQRPFRNGYFLNQSKHYVIGDRGDTGASGNLHDDLVMAYGIAEQLRGYMPGFSQVDYLGSMLDVGPTVIDARYGMPWDAIPGSPFMGGASHYGIVDDRYGTGQENLDAWLLGGPRPGVIDNRY